MHEDVEAYRRGFVDGWNSSKQVNEDCHSHAALPLIVGFLIGELVVFLAVSI